MSLGEKSLMKGRTILCLGVLRRTFVKVDADSLKGDGTGQRLLCA